MDAAAHSAGQHAVQSTLAAAERDFFIDNLLVRIHLVMIRWTGLAP